MSERIDPWGSTQIKDYEHLFKEFGINKITEEQKKFFDHRLFRRNIVVGHRDLDKLIEALKNKKPCYCMSGIASSGKLHFGHKAILDLHILFKKKGAKLFTGIADIDGFVSRQKISSLEEAQKYAEDNLTHALALGIEPEDIFVQSNMNKRYYSLVFEMSKHVTNAEMKAVYGDIDFGKVSANFLQYADILHPQLFEKPMIGTVPVSFDQDPHVRLTRDLAKRLPYKMIPPGAVYPLHQSGLKEGKKMSSSEPETAIYLSDTPQEAADKLKRAFTGGRDTEQEQRKSGGRPEICKIYEMYRYHMEDEKKLSELYKNCKSGKMLCGECKKICIEFVTKFLEEHQKKFKKMQPIAKKLIYGKS
jgi:tryptophanyl-tRNA synthetase